MTDLEDEAAEVTAVYFGAAVTEVATLRGELFGPSSGDQEADRDRLHARSGIPGEPPGRRSVEPGRLEDADSCARPARLAGPNPRGIRQPH